MDVSWISYHAVVQTSEIHKDSHHKVEQHKTTQQCMADEYFISRSLFRRSKKLLFVMCAEYFHTLYRSMSSGGCEHV